MIIKVDDYHLVLKGEVVGNCCHRGRKVLGLKNQTKYRVVFKNPKEKGFKKVQFQGIYFKRLIMPYNTLKWIQKYTGIFHIADKTAISTIWYKPIK